MTKALMRECILESEHFNENSMKHYIDKVLMLLLIANVAISQQVRVCDKMLQSGEELVYKVKWQFVRLGTITVRAERETSSTDSTLYKFIMIVESNPDLVFIKIHEYNESLVSAVDMMSRGYRGVHQNDKEKVEIRLTYNEVNHRVFYADKDLSSGKILRADTLEHVPPYVEGPTLFFYARWQSRSKRVLKVPTITNGIVANTDLDFTVGREYVEIDAVDEPIRTRKYKGFVGWEGGTAAGLSGEFIGWVSDDDAAVPIQGEMKVLLGSIRIELEKWVRADWAPPVYVELVKQ